jgi:hypothetical protein
MIKEMKIPIFLGFYEGKPCIRYSHGVSAGYRILSMPPKDGAPEYHEVSYNYVTLKICYTLAQAIVLAQDHYVSEWQKLTQAEKEECADSNIYSDNGDEDD